MNLRFLLISLCYIHFSTQTGVWNWTGMNQECSISHEPNKAVEHAQQHRHTHTHTHAHTHTHTHTECQSYQCFVVLKKSGTIQSNVQSSTFSMNAIQSTEDKCVEADMLLALLSYQIISKYIQLFYSQQIMGLDFFFL